MQVSFRRYSLTHCLLYPLKPNTCRTIKVFRRCCYTNLYSHCRQCLMCHWSIPCFYSLGRFKSSAFGWSIHIEFFHPIWLLLLLHLLLFQNIKNSSLHIGLTLLVFVVCTKYIVQWSLQINLSNRTFWSRLVLKILVRFVLGQSHLRVLRWITFCHLKGGV